MSAPEVRDITFDRPDYTSGAFIVFVGQNTEIAPPGPFWARKAFNKQLAFVGDIQAGSYKLVLPYTVPTGKTLFVTDVVIENAGSFSSGEPRYPVTGYWYRPQIPQVYVDVIIMKVIGTTDITLDTIVMHPTTPTYSKTYQTPLVFYGGEKLEVRAAARLGSAFVSIFVMGYETAP
jgi:hypothetical protein